MKFLQGQGFVPTPSSHFVQAPSSHPLIPTPFRICIRRLPSPPKPQPSLPSIRPEKCLTTKFPTFFSAFPVIQVSAMKTTSRLHFSATHLPLMAAASFPLPCFAAEIDQISSKINIESVVVAIDDFFNRYPYFVASLAFVWLVVIPLTEEYLNKYKYISCIDAFRKLRDDPSTQLLDIRQKQSVRYLRTPSLKILGKEAAHLEFEEGCEEEFAKEALKSFEDPGSTILCVLDNFDGNSLKVAKLLFKNGFKEVYAIKGGMLGNDGWQAIQGTLLPPAVHVYPRKKSRQSTDEVNGIRKEKEENEKDIGLLSSFNSNQKAVENTENDHIEFRESSPSTTENFQGRPQSPYPNHMDLKPPSSPTPSSSQS